MSAIKLRIRVEKDIMARTVKALLAAGYHVGVNDSEELTVPPTTDEAAIIAATYTTDEDVLVVAKEGKPAGWVRFIYGNDGWDVISDYTTNLEDVLRPVNAYADSLS